MKRVKGSTLFAVLLGGIFAGVVILSAMLGGGSQAQAAGPVSPVVISKDCCPPGLSKCQFWNCPIFIADRENMCGKNAGLGYYETAPAISCPAVELYNICKQAGPKMAECVACAGSGGTGTPSKMYTAIGCIPTDFNGMVTTLVRFALGLAGGVLLLIILNAAFQMATSQGDPKVISEAQASFTAAISGLLFIIFSVLIMETIGVKILFIPGF